MRRSIVLMTLAIGVMCCLTFLTTPSLASKGVVKMVGEITAIDLMHKTVVIEVPVGKSVFEEQLFTVGGRLSPDAELKRGGRSAKLGDFKVGDRVTVRWKATEEGHTILLLKAK